MPWHGWHSPCFLHRVIGELCIGITYKRDQSGGFIHSNVITVLNKAGEIVHRHEGLQQDMTSTLEAMRRAVQD